jgi:hypothetical protein
MRIYAEIIEELEEINRINNDTLTILKIIHENNIKEIRALRIEFEKILESNKE